MPLMAPEFRIARLDYEMAIRTWSLIGASRSKDGQSKRWHRQGHIQGQVYHTYRYRYRCVYGR